MRVEVFEKSADPTLRVKYKTDGDKVLFYAVNERGEPIAQGKLFAITPKGILLFSCVNPALGLPLDTGGYIKVIRD